VPVVDLLSSSVYWDECLPISKETGAALCSTSWASGNAGRVVLELREPASVSTTNAVGFHIVILVDGDISTAFIEDRALDDQEV
jgi:hypothetical protein